MNTSFWIRGLIGGICAAALTFPGYAEGPSSAGGGGTPAVEFNSRPGALEGPTAQGERPADPRVVREYNSGIDELERQNAIERREVHPQAYTTDRYNGYAYRTRYYWPDRRINRRPYFDSYYYPSDLFAAPIVYYYYQKPEDDPNYSAEPTATRERRNPYEQWVEGHYEDVPHQEVIEGEFVEVYHPAVYRKTDDGKLEKVESEKVTKEPKVRLIIERVWIPGRHEMRPPVEIDPNASSNDPNSPAARNDANAADSENKGSLLPQTPEPGPDPNAGRD